MTRQYWMNGLLAVTTIVGIVSGGGVAAAIGDVRNISFPSSGAEKGEVLFTQICRSCDITEPDKNKVGPSLFGAVGQPAGSVQHFDYSDAMDAAHLTRNDETLDRSLADPKNFARGNKMPYSLLMGAANAEGRKNVIAYLHTIE